MSVSAPADPPNLRLASSLSPEREIEQLRGELVLIRSAWASERWYRVELTNRLAQHAAEARQRFTRRPLEWLIAALSGAVAALLLGPAWPGQP